VSHPDAKSEAGATNLENFVVVVTFITDLHHSGLLVAKVILPLFTNIRYFSVVKLMYLDTF
jgi:hypothetical protein